MAIKNYTTSINPNRTIAEIQALLAQKGAVAVNIEYLDTRPHAIFFRIKVQEQFIDFRLPCNVEGVLRAMSKGKSVPQWQRTAERAEWVAWRIVKDWIDAQMAIVESGQAQMGEVFLPYAVTRNGMTLYESLKADPSRLLTTKAEETEAEYV